MLELIPTQSSYLLRKKTMMPLLNASSKNYCDYDELMVRKVFNNHRILAVKRIERGNIAQKDYF
jgi:hypothetical protein